MTACGRPPRSTAETASVSSIGITKYPARLMPRRDPRARGVSSTPPAPRGGRPITNGDPLLGEPFTNHGCVAHPHQHEVGVTAPVGKTHSLKGLVKQRLGVVNLAQVPGKMAVFSQRGRQAWGPSPG